MKYLLPLAAAVLAGCRSPALRQTLAEAAGAPAADTTSILTTLAGKAAANPTTGGLIGLGAGIGAVAVTIAGRRLAARLSKPKETK